jgi:hypothetical protein
MVPAHAGDDPFLEAEEPPPADPAAAWPSGHRENPAKGPLDILKRG